MPETSPHTTATQHSGSRLEPKQPDELRSNTLLDRPQGPSWTAESWIGSRAWLYCKAWADQTPGAGMWKNRRKSQGRSSEVDSCSTRSRGCGKSWVHLIMTEARAGLRENDHGKRK